VDKKFVDRIRELIADAERKVPYASATIFAGEGMEIRIDRKDEKIAALKANRGLVLTIFNGEYFQEFATDEGDPDRITRFFRAAADSVKRRRSKFEIPPGVPQEASHRTGERINPDKMSATEKLDLMRGRRDRILKAEKVVNAMVTYTERMENKTFINRVRVVEEHVRRITHFLIAFVTDGKTMKSNFLTTGGTGGLERIEVRDEKIDEMIDTARKLLEAERIAPNFYEVAAAPSVTGLIAHEAFGHGVEIDMYLKGRARSRDFLGAQIASPIVNIVDDPTVPDAYGSYFIDDEGEPARPTYIIKDGRYVQGIGDLYSSIVTGLPKTANGRRESFERKIYSRMSNTFIQPHNLTPAEIIAAVENGVYLEQGLSGMEDPKGWGIQIIVHYGREIRNGKLTDRIFSPLGLTGYVPELLQNISMIGNDFELDGGTCGKGHKEYVPVSSGGPHIRTRVRLG
jgi:TldD protein